MKGNPGGNPANLPNIPLSDEEKRQIYLMNRYRESFSHADIANFLNKAFFEYNQGRRTRRGVEKFLADPVQQRSQKSTA